MTEAQEKLAWDLVHKPPPGSEIAKAGEFGVDLTLVIATLHRTPAERARVLSENARIFQPAEQNASSENGIWKRRFASAASRPWQVSAGSPQAAYARLS